MKKALLIIISLLSVNLIFAQENELHRKVVDGVLTYENVVKVDSTLTAEQIYSKALLFCANEFKSANEVVQLKDETNNIIIAKGLIQMDWPTLVGTTNGYTEFTLSIYCKDGKYKYVINNLAWQQQMKMKLSTYSHNQRITLDNIVKKDNNATRKILSQLDERINYITSNLSKYINSKEDNW